MHESRLSLLPGYWICRDVLHCIILVTGWIFVFVFWLLWLVVLLLATILFVVCSPCLVFIPAKWEVVRRHIKRLFVAWVAVLEKVSSFSRFFTHAERWNRKVMKQQPLPLPYKRKTNPSQMKFMPQQESPFFCKLPLELRQTIYELLFSSDMHIVELRDPRPTPKKPLRSKLGAFPCPLPRGEYDNIIRSRCINRLVWPLPWFPASSDDICCCDLAYILFEPPRNGPLLALQSQAGHLSPTLTCRQFYQESINTLYS